GSFGGGISGVPVRGEVRMRGLVGNLRLHQEAVTLARDGFNIERLVGGIAERLAELVNGGIDVGVVVDVRIGRPEAHAKLFAGDDFTGLLEERKQNLINFALKL